jgi:hypothetical protein
VILLSCGRGDSDSLHTRVLLLTGRQAGLQSATLGDGLIKRLDASEDWPGTCFGAEQPCSKLLRPSPQGVSVG